MPEKSAATLFSPLRLTIRPYAEMCQREKPQTENEKFAMRTYLNHIGFVGEEFANCREHLTAHLDGSAAWRFRAAV